MFGYVRIAKPELKVKEYETYKAVYCSLCKYLGKQYGILSRLTLSYDFTFLALLKLSLSDKCESFYRGRCAFNPVKKCNYLKCDDALDLPAAAAMIMLYYKLLDNISDEKGIKKIAFMLLKPFFISAHKKAAKRFPELESIVKNYIDKQSSLENADNELLDAAADPTALALQNIFSLLSDDDNEKRVLGRLGYCLGRYIYILDAACDYEKDLKSGSYNVLKHSPKGADKEEISSKLYFCVNEASLAFELLGITKFKNILGNIIYLGLEDTFKKELD